MAARLGNVLYWAACLIAAVLAAPVVLEYTIFNGEGDRFMQAVVLGIAVVVWLIGRACRYVLADR